MATEIFVSYSHADAAYLGKKSLLGYLRRLKRQGASFWTDEEILVGTKWRGAIKAALERADLAMVLVSQEFLDSRFVRHHEIPPLLNRSRDDGLIIFPIILSPCDWRREPWLRQRQFIPTNNRTIEQHFSRPADKRRRMFQQITEALRKHVTRIEKTKHHPDLRGSAMKAFSKSVNMVNELYPQVEATAANAPEDHREHSVMIEGKGDHVVQKNHGKVKTFTPDDLKKLSERQLRHISIFQQDLESSYAKWKKLYRRRQKEMPHVTARTRSALRDVIADMKDSLDRVMAFLNAAKLDIEDHYAFFQSVIDSETELAYKVPEPSSSAPRPRARAR